MWVFIFHQYLPEDPLLVPATITEFVYLLQLKYRVLTRFEANFFNLDRCRASELFPHGSIHSEEFRNLNIVQFLDCSVRETDLLESSTGNKTEFILKKNDPK